MPPPMPNPAKRMTANPARPVARYRPGKPIAEQESSDEGEESEEEQQRPPPQRKPQTARPQPARAQPPRQGESDEDDEEGFVTDEEESADVATKQIAQQPVKGTVPPAKQIPIKQEYTRKESEEESSEEESTEEEEEEEEETSSEEEAPRRKFQRPTFIKKADRKPSTQAADAGTEAAANGTTADPEVDTQTRRLAQAELLIKDKLERDALARLQGKKAWDDDDDLVPESMVDDTDGLDPEAEYAAWKLRELKRLKRDREALIAREKEIEEIERRRNLTAEEREKEDKAYLEKQKQERVEGRSETVFLARYHHKGAFFQGEETAELLKRRDVMGARFEDQVTDKSTLPEYMRLRDMTKLGKKGRTRYTDLKGEDTGRFGEEVKRWKGSGGAGRGGFGVGTGDFDTRGLDERFLPDDDRGRAMTGPTGANASAVAPRRDRDRDGEGHTDRNSNRDSYRPRDREHDRQGDRGRERDRRKRSYSRSRSRSGSRSRSPRRRKKEHLYEGDERDREPYRRENRARA